MLRYKELKFWGGAILLTQHIPSKKTVFLATVSRCKNKIKSKVHICEPCAHSLRELQVFEHRLCVQKYVHG